MERGGVGLAGIAMSESFDAPPTAAETQAASFDTPPTAAEQGVGFDSPPTAAESGPALAPPLAEPPAQPQTDEEYAALMDPMAGTPLSVAAFNAQRGIPHEEVAKAMRYGEALGVDPESLMGDPKALASAKEEVDFRESIKTLKEAPRLAALMAHNTALANVAREDLPNLSAIEAGVMDVAHWYYARKAMGGEETATSRLHDIDRMLSRYEKEEHGLVAQAARLLPGAEAFGLAGVGGALLAGPAAAGGAVMGPFILMYQSQKGELFKRIKDADTAQAERDPTYTPLTDKQIAGAAKDGAIMGATIVTALGSVFQRSLPFVSGALERLGVNIVVEATEDTAVKLALRRILETGAHTLSGTMAMVGQAVSDDATVQKATTGDVDIGKATKAGVEVLKNTIGPIALLSAAGPARAYAKDLGRIRAAPVEVGQLDRMADMVRSSKAASRAPEQMKAIIRSLAEDGADTAFVGHEALKDPNVAKAVAASAGEHAVAEAQATQGAVPMPIEDYLVDVAPEHHKNIREHVRLSEDGASLAEAREIKPDLDAALAAIPADQRAAVEKIARRMEGGEAGPDTLGALMAARDYTLQSEPDTPERAAKLQDIEARMRSVAARGQGMPDTGKGTPEEVAAEMKKLEAEMASGQGPAPAAEPEAPQRPVPPTIPENAFRRMAREATEGKRLGDMRPDLHRRNAESNAKRALDMGAEAVSGQVAGVKPTEAQSLDRLTRLAEAEQARDYSRALERTEREALEEGEKSRAFLQRYATKEGLAELGKASPEMRDAVSMLLSGFELAEGTSRPEVARRLATMQWLANEEAQGYKPYVPDSVLDKLDRFVHWKEMTPQEMRDLRNSVESIVRQAELKNTILSDQGRRDFRESKKEVIEGVLANRLREIPVFQKGDVVPLAEQVAGMGRALESVVLKPEEIVRRLDGGKVDGPVGRYFWHPLSEAFNRALALGEKWVAPIKDAIEAVPKETRRKWKTETFEIAGRERTMEQAIAVALNQGNASNAFKTLEGLRNGSALGLTDWTQGTVDAFLAHVNRDGWNFAQSIWDNFDTQWDTIAKHDEYFSGILPEKLVHRGFDLWFDEKGNTVPSGTEGAEKVHFRGGYYPIIYEAQFNWMNFKAREGELMSPNYRSASVATSRTQSRIESYARPVQLTLDGLPGIVREFAKDVAMREALMSTHKLINDPDVVNALNRSIGEGNRRVLQSTVLNAANDMVLPSNPVQWLLQKANRLRGGATASIFSWNIAQTTQNLAGVTQIGKHVPEQFIREALRAMILNPTGTIDFARMASGEMATRSGNINAEMADAHKMIQNDAVAISHLNNLIAPAKEIAQLGLEVFQSTDSLVSNLAWRSSYEHAIAPKEKGGLGYGHETAVRQAERTLRLSIASGRIIDLPAFLQHPVTKLLAPFSGWSATQLNDYLGTVHDARVLFRDEEYWRGVRKLASAHVWVAAGGIAGSLLSFKGPKDVKKDGIDVGDHMRWLAIEGLLAPLWYTPYLGSPMKTTIAEGEPLRRSLFAPVIARPFETVFQKVGQIRSKKNVKTEDWEKFGLGMLEAAAMAGGLPVVQPKATGGYLLDPKSPKDNLLQIGLGVAAGKSAPGKLIELTK